MIYKKILMRFSHTNSTHTYKFYLVPLTLLALGVAGCRQTTRLHALYWQPWQSLRIAPLLIVTHCRRNTCAQQTRAFYIVYSQLPARRHRVFIIFWKGAASTHTHNIWTPLFHVYYMRCSLRYSLHTTQPLPRDPIPKPRGVYAGAFPSYVCSVYSHMQVVKMA